MRYTIAQLKEILSAELLQSNGNEDAVEYISVDTRKISFPSKTLFVALKTLQRNGHDFIADANAKGVNIFLVSERKNYPEGTTILFVADTLKALQQLATFHRKQFTYPVIGITGSNGKTIVKEWLNHLLQSDFNIVRSPGSYNSQIGVPLSVLQMTSAHDLAIFEAGISKPNEMTALANIIQPTIGVFTHAGDAHSENFQSLQQKIEEKANLFATAENIVFNIDDADTYNVVRNYKCNKYSFGKTEEADIKLISSIVKNRRTQIQVSFQNKDYTFSIPFTTAAAVENALCAFAVCNSLHVDLQTVSERMHSLPQQELRLQMQKALQDSILINDSYSFDLSSLAIALDFLSQQKETYSTTVILSDLPSHQSDQYEEVITMLKERNINRCILIGSEWKQHLPGSMKVEYFETAESFRNGFSASRFQHEIILLKGAREFRFDELAQLFLQQVHQTVMRIDLTAMVHNLKAFKELLTPDIKIMAMVKAFGYGSGGSEPAKLLQYHGVNYLAVAYADEGAALRKDGISLPIMVLNTDEAAYHSLVEYNLEPEIFSFHVLRSFETFLIDKGITDFPVHIKLDTGMHRLGFEENDIEELCAALQRSKTFVVRSVFTHLAASEDPQSDDFTEKQYKQFASMRTKLHNALGYDFISHISNSAAALRHRYLDSEMIRLGIGLYGVKPAAVNISLKTVAYLTTTIAQLRKVKAGDSIGYNRKGIVERDSIIATLRIGYADGFRRALGNGVGRVYVKGQYAPIIGSVCMDMIMADVTDIADVQEDEEVEIMGSNIPVEELAIKCQTIPYEILTGIAGRVKRVYVME